VRVFSSDSMEEQKKREKRPPESSPPGLFYLDVIDLQIPPSPRNKRRVRFGHYLNLRVQTSVVTVQQETAQGADAPKPQIPTATIAIVLGVPTRTLTTLRVCFVVRTELILLQTKPSIAERRWRDCRWYNSGCWSST
jgi:hypothetical protein